MKIYGKITWMTTICLTYNSDSTEIMLEYSSIRLFIYDMQIYTNI